MSINLKLGEDSKFEGIIQQIVKSGEQNNESLSVEKFIDNLNQDLMLEYSAMIQYVQHASIIQGPGFESFIDHLYEHADDEFKHAKMISEKINYLGGMPAITMNVSSVLTSNISRELLEQDLSSEQTAISRYKQRIVEAEQLGEYGIKHMLEQILLDEEEHENDLLTILNKRKQ